MEVEVKLRLVSAAAHATLVTQLSPFILKTHHQHNLFLDTVPSSLLSTHKSALRLRFFGPSVFTATRCVLSLKSKPVLIHGVSRVEEIEEELDPDVGKVIIDDPTRFWERVHGDSRVLERVKGQLGELEERWVCLGGFENVRRVYGWEGLRLEVDETVFGFGERLYEVECESEEPEIAKGKIEGFLRENGIGFEDSVVSKFGIFRAGKLPELRSMK